MHSRVFEVYKDAEELTNNNDWTEDQVLSGLRTINPSTDYVIEMDEKRRKEDIAWIHDCYDNDLKIDIEKKEWKLNLDSPLNYFKSKYDVFKSKVEDLYKITQNLKLEDYAYDTPGTSLSFQMYMIREAYEEDGGFMILYDGELFTLDYFMRNIVRVLLDAKEEITLHFNRTWDYHM